MIILFFCCTYTGMVSAFSVPKAKRQEKYNQNPGPGQYNSLLNPQKVKPADPKFSFGKEPRRQISDQNKVGPGQYDGREEFVKHKNPSYSIQGRKQENLDKSKVGPGAYDPSDKYSRVKSPNYSISGRLNDDPKQNLLGPGQYDLKGTLDQHRNGFHFSKERRENIDKRNVPGPGSYEYQNAVFKYGSKQDPSYGFGSKLKDPDGLKVPGPGSYEYDNRKYFSKIGGMMSKQLRDYNDNSKTPGPGNYQINANKVKNRDPSWSLSKSSRDYIPKSNSVGPGQYQVEKQYKSLYTSHRGYNFGSEKRLHTNMNDLPGPGQYSSVDEKSRKGGKIGQKINDLKGLDVPGPGSYDNEQYDYRSWMKGSGRYSLGKSSRIQEYKTNAPGPGAYSYGGINSSSRISFGRESRLKDYGNKNPGPGSYDLKPFFADVPKYLLPLKS